MEDDCIFSVEGNDRANSNDVCISDDESSGSEDSEENIFIAKSKRKKRVISDDEDSNYDPLAADTDKTVKSPRKTIRNNSGSKTASKEPKKKSVKKKQQKEESSDEESDDERNTRIAAPTGKKKSRFLIDSKVWKTFMEENEPTLDEISKMQKEVSSTTSRNQKMEIMGKHYKCAKILLYVYNPFWQYYNSSTRVKKTLNNPDVRTVSAVQAPKSVFRLLDMLRNREVTGNAALNVICSFITNNKKHENLIYCMLDKNLKIRCGRASINDVFENLVPEFPVALANDINDVPQGHVNFEGAKWVASRKYDGVRVLCIVKKGIAEFRSREGNVFVTLQKLEKVVNDWGMKEDGIFDGEVCIFEGEKEDFKKAVSELKRKSGMVQSPRYVIWDFLTPQEFESKTSERTYLQRLKYLKKFLSDKKFYPYISITQQIEVLNQEHLDKLRNTAVEKTWEGLMIRKDCEYEGKRGNNLLKIKQFKDKEVRVKRMQIGPMRHPVDGKDIEVQTMRNVTVDNDGYEVDVGSGFTMAERELFKNNPDLIIGKIITVAYFEETEDHSLRFPSFKGLCGKKRSM